MADDEVEKFNVKAEINVVGLHEAPELFVEGYVGAISRPGLVKFNLFSTKFNSTNKKVERYVTATIVMSELDFYKFADQISKTKNGMQEKFKKRTGVKKITKD
ncbi:hypothetical protein [Rhodovarius lipocyclicus]|uniref:hypothetical protein n=1 Tax=Rhodovarius lipocyclicus TaxID=268410 RepID=UPI00135CA180|nr:hypothetical protein [Rhodovarius lipocyclicus]